MKILNLFSMDAVLGFLTSALINISRFPNLLKSLHVLPEYSTYKAGEPLKILFVGYNGARNTGADVRVEVMTKQFIKVLGKENINIGITTLDVEHSKNYYHDPIELISMSSIFFKDILHACSRYHLAILCEGSCFKSQFANALTTFFLAAAGIMKVQNKFCIAYGSEAGYMDWPLSFFVKTYAKDTYIISRTVPSLKVIKKFGFDGDVGTDTAWSFIPSPTSKAKEILMAHGWDGKKPLLGLAVINPFCWPVKPNLFRLFIMLLTGFYKKNHHEKWYFFSTSRRRIKSYNRYLDAIKIAADTFCDKYDFFPIIIGMEKLDYSTNIKLQERMKHKAPIFCSKDYNSYDLTAILHQLSLLVTSRYHARVLSMPAGVPSCAISIDERLHNLLEETGHLNDYYIKSDDYQIKEKLLPMMEKLYANREKVKDELLKTIPSYLEKMSYMGELLKEFIKKKYPGFPVREKAAEFKDNLP
ncbi:MAG: polysaccharide pyruvyl transferase family protein [Oligoflexia bacterium]|nr:polysaccharide pyruvyl transferase family protein [Oligoflexia bacterium]